MSPLFRTISTALIGVFGSCLPAREFPNDFYVRLDSFANQPGAVNQSIIIYRDTSANTFVWQYDIGADVKRITLNDTELRDILSEVRKSKVFNLKSSYADFDVLDGGTNVLTIRLDRREKVIRMRNATPAELEDLLRMIWEAGKE